MNDQAHLLFALQVKPMTRFELEEFLGLPEKAVGKRLWRLRTKTPAIRIVAWRPQPIGVRGQPQAVYGLGDPADDVPPPPPTPRSIVRGRYEAKIGLMRVRQMRNASAKRTRLKNTQQRVQERERFEQQGQLLWSPLTWPRSPSRE